MKNPLKILWKILWTSCEKSYEQSYEKSYEKSYGKSNENSNEKSCEKTNVPWFGCFLGKIRNIVSKENKEINNMLKDPY